MGGRTDRVWTDCQCCIGVLVLLGYTLLALGSFLAHVISSPAHVLWATAFLTVFVDLLPVGCLFYLSRLHVELFLLTSFVSSRVYPPPWTRF